MYYVPSSFLRRLLVSKNNAEQLYMEFVRELATADGKSVHKIHEREKLQAGNPGILTKECIALDVAQAIVDLSLGVKEIHMPLDWIEIAKRHVSGCSYCQFMIAAMTPAK